MDVFAVVFYKFNVFFYMSFRENKKLFVCMCPAHVLMYWGFYCTSILIRVVCDSVWRVFLLVSGLDYFNAMDLT